MAKEKEKIGCYKTRAIRISERNWNILKNIRKKKGIGWNKFMSFIIQKIKNEDKEV
jgi:hypothetical protein